VGRTRRQAQEPHEVPPEMRLGEGGAPPLVGAPKPEGASLSRHCWFGIRQALGDLLPALGFIQHEPKFLIALGFLLGLFWFFFLHCWQNFWKYSCPSPVPTAARTGGSRLLPPRLCLQPHRASQPPRAQFPGRAPVTSPGNTRGPWHPVLGAEGPTSAALPSRLREQGSPRHAEGPRPSLLPGTCK